MALAALKIFNSPLDPKGRFYKAKRLKEFSIFNSQFSILNLNFLIPAVATS